MSDGSPENLVEIAKLAEQAERYDDMVKYMTELTTKKSVLTDEERNLLSVAFKNVVGARRSAWRIIQSMEHRHMEKKEENERKLAEEYKKQIEEELEARCNDVLKLIDGTLLKSVDEGEKSVEARVFYLKMKGDYFRYLVEVKPTSDDANSERAALAEKSKEAYKRATEAATDLANTHPIKLGLALNYSVFHYEIMSDGKEACTLARKAFDEAIAELDNLKEESYKDSTLIMQLLRDNLTLWTSENEPEGEN